MQLGYAVFVQWRVNARLPTETFTEAVLKAVKLNGRFMLLTSRVHRYIFVRCFSEQGAQIGVHPADEYLYVSNGYACWPLFFKGGFKTSSMR